MTRTAAVVLLACTAVLASCGGEAEVTAADRSACEAAAKISPISNADLAGTRKPATTIIGQLSGLTPDDERLARAVSQARDDAQAIVNAFSPLSYPKLEAGVAALDGSLSGIDDVCSHLGA